MAAHVDDCLVTGTNKKLVDESKKRINGKYRMTDLGPCRWLLGIKIERDLENRTISLSQHSYIDISDLPGFERQFQKWWVTIQPPWRVLDGKLLKDVMDGDWDSLRCPGLNGIISVLTALFYWCLAVKGKPGRKKVWVAAVGDCHIVFRHLLA